MMRKKKSAIISVGFRCHLKAVWVKKIALSSIVALVIGYFSVQWYTSQRLYVVQGNVIEMNPEITEIHEIHSIGGWGEWFSEFTLVAEMNGVKYRIWTTDNGVITDQEEY